VLLDNSQACRATLLLLLLLLLQVVVDSHESAKALLDRGQLTKRVTIIPLNQVRRPAAVLLPSTRSNATCGLTVCSISLVGRGALLLLLMASSVSSLCSKCVVDPVSLTGDVMASSLSASPSCHSPGATPWHSPELRSARRNGTCG
jgi:hypothetical protein